MKIESSTPLDGTLQNSPLGWQPNWYTATNIQSRTAENGLDRKDSTQFTLLKNSKAYSLGDFPIVDLNTRLKLVMLLNPQLNATDETLS